MRIVTRPDFDGIVCAVLLSDVLNIQEPVKWVEPNVLQRGLVEIRKGDIIANLPYDDRCTLWFDHHYTNRIYRSYRGVFQIAPSAAGLIYEHYKDRFKRDYGELVGAVDKIDSADLTLDQVLHPEKHDYVLLSMTVFNGDHSCEIYWDRLVGLLGKYDIQQVMDDPDVKRRCEEVIKQNNQYTVYLEENTRLEKNVSITDFRNLPKTPVGNRFLVYSLFPESYVNVRIRYEDKNRETVAVSVGHSIFNSGCKVNAGLLLSDFGGGGHRGAASCRFHKSQAEEIIPQIIEALEKNECNEN
ncbi:MAG: exopolyphosphatase [Deltaproteobacteria bacterium]|jgi:oligoribonuclease NrnB/cAMP/cGMP phosphodiesterase (DHH superfamily)|nr:exopolyphosphatase [Deltaproteobacteria bacterium]